MSDNKNNDWLFEIKPKDSLIRLNLKEVWQYRDLLFLFVKRDVVTLYKQTVLGPLWYVIQPLITSLIFTLIFNNRGVYLATYDNFLITSTFTFHHSVN
jgi:lipopolysaccharide transport system permease protein